MFCGANGKSWRTFGAVKSAPCSVRGRMGSLLVKLWKNFGRFMSRSMSYLKPNLLLQRKKPVSGQLYCSCCLYSPRNRLFSTWAVTAATETTYSQLFWPKSLSADTRAVTSLIPLFSKHGEQSGLVSKYDSAIHFVWVLGQSDLSYKYLMLRKWFSNVSLYTYIRVLRIFHFFLSLNFFFYRYKDDVPSIYMCTYSWNRTDQSISYE